MATENFNDIGVLLEDMNDKIVGIAEAVSDLNTKVTIMDARLTSVEKDTKLIRSSLQS